ncbi:hypothetical protein [Paucibacter sp. Y2R2-4]|uniref:ORC-CDC6 family AAA ATPase n=1 Tax=Paucibacter sp. Y2R2-4 TaxID=2893553 RepID=UPI0021E47F86|nr:hypothetical protein [Paucibacter sp. Y2R2-4]MCV2349439.1 hypothetical protein [Paucibacter sp. Y2R2-4]
MTTSPPASPFFGAYNARHINSEEVARQFVPSRKFWELIALRNSLLIGPRGSGKTHLLKMLQPKALAAWSGPDASTARSKISFWAVFTPADINWKTQVDQRARSLDPEVRKGFVNAVFLSHFREAFISCILQLTRDRPAVDHGNGESRVELSKEDETTLCIALANAWDLPLGVPSLGGLRVSLVRELANLGSPAFLTSLTPYMTRLTSMTVLGVAREIAEHFANVTGRYDGRWALCFDELEIAPVSIQNDLFQYLRSTDQRFVFKLAISPSNDASALLNNQETASAGNDYDPIPLWFVDQGERDQFCLRLWEKHAEGTLAAPISPQSILQRSRFQFANEIATSGPRRYSEASGWKRDFEYLESIDASFASYLADRRISTAALNSTPRDFMDKAVRKVAPIVGFRAAYLEKSKDAKTPWPVRRKLKTASPDIFSGWEAVCTATEGNPRWFSGIASRLILKWSQSVSSRSLTREQQTNELQASAKKFLAWINAVPVEPQAMSINHLSLYDLITSLARYFEQSVLGRKFTADPVLAFVVDKGTPIHIQRLVMTALNIGAIVIVDDEDINFTAATPVGRSFRLVHLLAPHFNLLMRKGKAVNLSTILKVNLDRQLGLFS